MRKCKVLSLFLALVMCLGVSSFMVQAVELDEAALEDRGINLYGSHTFQEGLMPALVDGVWNYINEDLEVVDLNQGRFIYVFPFYEGLAAVMDKATFLTGYIDKTGKLVIPCQYGGYDQMGSVYAPRFHDGVATVLKENYSAHMDPVTWFYSPGQWEVATIDKKGKLLTDYTTVEGMDPSLYLVADSGETIEPEVQTAPSAGGLSKEGYGPYTYTPEGSSQGYTFDLAKVAEKTLAFAMGSEIRTVTVLELHPDCAIPAGMEEERMAGYNYYNEFFEAYQADTGDGAGPSPEWKTAKEWFEEGGYALAEFYHGPYVTLAGTQLHEATPPTAKPSTQTVTVDGDPVEFAMYALWDNGGNQTNYIRVRDLAALLNGTAAQFEVGWDGKVALTAKAPYTGSADKAPFSTEMPYTVYTEPTYVNGSPVTLDAIQIEYNGGGFTYYKLRDLAQALGFNVGWSADKGVYVETNKPYDPNN